MGYARETIVGYVDSLTGSTTYDALTPNSGQSFTVRAFPDGANCQLEDVWMSAAAHPANLSIKSPRMHDDVYGILLAMTPLGVGSGDADFNPQTMLPGWVIQQLYSTDVLSVTANGTATDAVVGVFNVRYSNLGGINGRFTDWQTIKDRIVNLVGVQVQPEASGTVGVFGNGVYLNSLTTRLKANTDYAWLGYTMSKPCAAVVMNGVDLGNLNVGGPGDWDLEDTGAFFVSQSERYGTPCIGVINSNNQGGTTVKVADVIADTEPFVTLLFGQLPSGLVPTL